MKEYLVNNNEYIEDGKHYIETIKRCSCTEWCNGYYLHCKIRQRGERRYYLSEDCNFICKGHREAPEKNRLYLSDAAKATVREAIEEFKEKTNMETYVYFQIDSDSFGGYRRHETDSLKYDLYLVIRQGNKAEHRRYYEKISVAELFFYIYLNCRFPEENKYEKYYPLDQELYKIAVQNDDELLQKQLRLFFKQESKDDAEWLSEKYGTRVLPRLPEEYDKTFIVDKNTIDIPILDCSEYVILHRPYFAMEGYTHKAWGLNPCQKTGSDSVKQGEPSISFEEFLSMFEADKKQVKS